MFIAPSITLADFDAFVFHTPFSKLVQKAVARLAYLDVLENTTVPYGDANKVASFRYVIHVNTIERTNRIYFSETTPEATYTDRVLEKAFIDFSDELFKQKTEPSLHFAKLIGNMYTPSVYAALVSYLTRYVTLTCIGITSETCLTFKQICQRITRSEDRLFLVWLGSSLGDVQRECRDRRRILSEVVCDACKLDGDAKSAGGTQKSLAGGVHAGDGVAKDCVWKRWV